VLFIALSNPFGLVMDTVSNEAEHLNVSSSVNPFISNLRMIFGLTFVLSAAGTVLWFILGAHKDEYEEY